jgi:hypothetical protein
MKRGTLHPSLLCKESKRFSKRMFTPSTDFIQLLTEQSASWFGSFFSSNDPLRLNVFRFYYCSFIWNFSSIMSRDSVKGTATGYGLDDQVVAVRVPVRARIFTSPCRPDRLCGSPKLLTNGYRELLPRGQSSQGVKLTTHLQLVPRSRKCESIHPLTHTPSWRGQLDLLRYCNIIKSLRYLFQCVNFMWHFDKQ